MSVLVALACIYATPVVGLFIGYAAMFQLGALNDDDRTVCARRARRCLIWPYDVVVGIVQVLTWHPDEKENQ